jgi:O-antigen ligase
MIDDVAAVALLAALFVVGGRYGLRHPMRALALYAASVPFGSGIALPLPLPVALSTVSSVLGLFATGCLAADVLVSRRRSGTLLRAVPVWLLFTGVVMSTYFWSIDPTSTAQQSIALAALAALFVMALLARSGERDLEWFEGAVIAGGAATGVYALLLLVSGGLTAGADALPRFATAGGIGTEADPNITAASLLLPLILSLAWATGRRTPLTRLAAAGATTLILAAIMLTGSRGGLIAALVGCAVLLRHSRRAMTAMVVVGIVAAMTFAFTPTDLRDRLVSSDSTGRAEVWQVGVRSCSQYCLTGSGAETFIDVYERTLFANPDLAGHGKGNYKAHNLWLALLVEEGVAGLALAAAGFAVLFADLRSVAWRRRAAPVAALVALLVSNMFLNNVAFKYFWLVLLYAGLVTVVRGPTQSEQAGLAARLRRPAEALAR